MSTWDRRIYRCRPCQLVLAAVVDPVALVDGQLFCPRCQVWRQLEDHNDVEIANVGEGT